MSNTINLRLRILSRLMPAHVLDTTDSKAAQAETNKRAAHADELGKRIDELVDWWVDDAQANHYARRIQAALRAETTGSQKKIEDK